MVRNRFRGTFSLSLAAAGLALFVASPLFGQASTGTVQGRVVDEATSAPIAGASVTVAGTSIGNLTNDQGYYFLNEVPAGLQTVRAEFIGYRAVEITDERILADQTTTLNFQLSSSAVELEAIVVEGERNPLVPRDQTSTKSIVQGETIDQLPLDNATGIVVLQPGVVETNRGRTIRGGRPNEEAVVIDGVLTRGFGTGTSDNISLPTNALEQVDVNVGAFSAEFGEGQSGVVSFVTKSGGAAFTGSLEYLTDQLSPADMRTNFNRAELSLGGPIAGPLTFFLAGTLQGQDAFTTTAAPNRFVISGDDVCPDAPQFSGLCTAGEVPTFQLPRGSSAAGATDFVEVTPADFVAWDNGRTIPFGWGQSDLFHANINWQLPRGSRLNFSYNRNRTQNFGPGTTLPAQTGVTNSLEALYNFDGLDGALTTRNSFAVSWFQTITQTADQQLAFDFLAAYSRDRGTTGMLDQEWYLDNQDPFLGYVPSNVEFAYDDVDRVTGFDAFEPSDEFLNAYRSNAVPRDSMLIFPNRSELGGTSQSLPGLTGNLRQNPYGMDTTFPVEGPGQLAINKNSEDRLQLRGSVDWQIGRFNRIKAGGEYFDIDLNAFAFQLTGGVPLPESAQPRKMGAFLQDRLDIGDLVLEAGVRWDYLDPDIEYPRVPGFVFNVPDSLRAGFVRYAGPDQGYVPAFDEPCGGVSPSNPSGVCRDNFVEAETKSEFSPRIGASFPVTPTSTFRLSYGRFVQTPAFFTTGSFAAGETGVAQGNLGLLQDVNFDLQNGNTNSTFARDVDMPSTRTFEFGYRQLIGEDLVVDLSAFNKKQRGALASRKLPFTDPNTGAITFLNVLTNQDFTESNGFEVKVDKAIGNFLTSNLSYSFLDARGTGSDPFFYENFIFRATTNLSALTGEPPNPPEALLRLEQGRKHNLSWTGSLAFPADFQEGSVAGALLQDLGVFAIMRVRSGLPYTKLENQANGAIGPPSAGGNPESTISGAETPWTLGVDLRFTKGFAIGEGLNLQAFVDWRNPFDLTNNNTVFLETGNVVNQLHREQTIALSLRDTQLDGSNDIDDVDIVAESTDNDFNKYMLLRAEQRWGDGDGIFTVEEQETAFGQVYENRFGVKSRFETSDQLMRLGLRLAF